MANSMVLLNFKETPEEKSIDYFPGCFFPIRMFICLIWLMMIVQNFCIGQWF